MGRRLAVCVRGYSEMGVKLGRGEHRHAQIEGARKLLPSLVVCCRKPLPLIRRHLLSFDNPPFWKVVRCYAVAEKHELKNYAKASSIVPIGSNKLSNEL